MPLEDGDHSGIEGPLASGLLVNLSIFECADLYEELPPPSEHPWAFNSESPLSEAVSVFRSRFPVEMLSVRLCRTTDHWGI